MEEKTYIEEPRYEEVKESNAFSITSLSMGIAGLMLFLAPYIAIFLSIMAIIFSSLQKPKNGMSTAGLVLGIIGILVNLFFLFIVVIMISIGEF